MGRHQCKNTFNNIKSDMAPPETRGSTSARPEHTSTDEAEENDFKKNKFMKIVKAFMKNSLKKLEKETNQKLEEINEFLK